ncbi:MAG: hypothetical protein ACK55Z_35715, partial [bacterium]
MMSAAKTRRQRGHSQSRAPKREGGKKKKKKGAVSSALKALFLLLLPPPTFFLLIFAHFSFFVDSLQQWSYSCCRNIHWNVR